MTPGHILNDARLGPDLDIVAGLDDAHEGHLQAADEVGQRVLEAERDSDTADAKSGYERIGVDAKTCIQDDADARRPDHAAGDIDDDAGGGQGIALLVEVALEDARCHASSDGGCECKGECPQRALHERDFEDGKWTFHGNSSGAYNGFDLNSHTTECSQSRALYDGRPGRAEPGQNPARQAPAARMPCRIRQASADDVRPPCSDLSAIRRVNRMNSSSDAAICASL